MTNLLNSSNSYSVCPIAWFLMQNEKVIVSNLVRSRFQSDGKCYFCSRKDIERHTPECI